jgi:signal transduction histidine kinase
VRILTQIIWLTVCAILAQTGSQAFGATILGSPCYVDLRATNASAGSPIWLNEAGFALGNFARHGSPVEVGNVAGSGVPGVYFDGQSACYIGPLTVPALEGHSARSVAVWALNPDVGQEETLVSWGHRNGFTGGNFAVGYGFDTRWGAAAHWNRDIGWPAENLPAANEWHFFVYTYDGDRSVKVYVDGMLSLSTNFSEPLQTYPGTVNIGTQRADDNSTAIPFSGYINSVRIYGGVISSQMISYLTAEGPCCSTPLRTPWQHMYAPMVTHYVLSSSPDFPERDPRDWQLLGSTNTGKTWIVLDRRQGESFTSRQQRREFVPTYKGFFDTYRLQIDAVREPGKAGGVQLSEIEPEILAQHFPMGSLSFCEVLAHGEDSPAQSAARAFDGNSNTSWSDSIPLDGASPSRWIQWRYVLTATNLAQLANLSQAPRGFVERIHIQSLVGGYDRDDRVVWVAEPTICVPLTLSEPCDFIATGQRVLMDGTVLVGTNGLLLAQVKVTVLQAASPRQMEIEEPLAADEDSIWAEMHGTLQRMGSQEGRMNLELLDGKRRASLVVLHGDANQLPPANVHVRVQGFCSGFINEKGERVAGLLTAMDSHDIKLALTEEDWRTLPPIPVSLLNSTNGKFLTGKLVRARGTVVDLTVGGNLVIEDGSTEINAYYSENGNNWTAMPDPTSLNISSPVYVGLAVSSRNNAALIRTVFDQVAGLSPGWKDIDIGGPGQAGSANFDGKSFTVSGGGGDIWGAADQFHFVYSRMDGDEIIGRVASMPKAEPWAKAGLMIRESLAADARYVDLTVTPLSCLFERRIQSAADCENMMTASVSGGPVWLKLVRSHHPKMVVSPDATANFPVGTKIDVMGKLDFADGTAVLESSICRFARNDFTDGQSTPLLTEVQQVRRLSREELGQGRRVLIRGVMTGHNYLQDATAGIYVFMDNHLEAGQFVEMAGFVTRGGFGPTLFPSKITILGPGKMPEPLHRTWDQLMTGKEDSQWIEIIGRVQSLTNQYLSVLTDGGPVEVVVENASTNQINQWMDTTLRIFGACAPFSNEGQVQGFVLRCPSPACVQRVHIPPEHPFDIPSQPIKSVRQYNAQDRFFKIEGIVTYRDDHFFIIEDATGGAKVRSVESGKMNVGDRAQVVGFPETGGYSPILSEAATYVIRHETKPKAMSVNLAIIQSGNFDARLVRLEGVLREQRTSYTGNQILELQTDQRVVETTLAKDSGAFPQLLKGSRLAVIGVCLNKSNRIMADDQRVSAFDLFVGSPADVVVLQQPAWWTLKRMMGVMALLVTVLVIALAWIRLLQQQVNERTRDLKEEIESHKEMEAKLEGEIEQRKRIQVENEDIHKRLIIVSREAGMAQVASDVLHHVRNILNSVYASTDVVLAMLQHSKVTMVAKVSALLNQHAGNLGAFLELDEKGKILPAYLDTIGATIVTEHQQLQKEVSFLREHLDQMQQFVATQEKYTYVVSIRETVPAGKLVEDAIELVAGEFDQRGVALIRNWCETPEITVDKYRFMEILANLLRNALRACAESDRPDKQVVITIGPGNAHMLRFEIADNGIGILPENLTKIFAVHFTRDHDFGWDLHNSANTARAMGGSLTARSDGLEQGAAFTIELPLHVSARK